MAFQVIGWGIIAVFVVESYRALPLGSFHTGCSAAWLARLSGGQEVVGSNPASPTLLMSVFLLNADKY